MKWFHYRQNNSGGSFDISDKVSVDVFIQARNGSHADERAEEIGIYFNGAEDGQDCECCGDRWYPSVGLTAEQGDDEPLLYGSKIPDDESQTRIYPTGFDKPVSIHDFFLGLAADRIRSDSMVIEPS